MYGWVDRWMVGHMSRWMSEWWSCDPNLGWLKAHTFPQLFYSETVSLVVK